MTYNALGRRRRTGVALPALQLRVEIEHPPGQHHRAVAQVGGGIGIAAQHGHHVARFEHRADPAPDRLRTIGQHHVDRDPDLAGNIFEQLAQPHRFVVAAHLGAGADRDVDHQVGRSRGQLL